MVGAVTKARSTVGGGGGREGGGDVMTSCHCVDNVQPCDEIILSLT